MISWSLWSALNRLIWQRHSRWLEEVVAFADSTLDQWLKAHGRGNFPSLRPLHKGDCSKPWSKPCTGIKLNVNAAIFKKDK